MAGYNHEEIEKKWQDFWEKNHTFKTENVSNKPKYYVLDMFPYPSGAGLHVGHPEGYTANDIIARYKHAKGFNVLHPMGWDAFGLPAENYAIKTGTHPRITTAENIATFKRQIQSLGFSYDWDREIDTTDPKYFQWTQWVFLKLFEHGLAYEQDLPINYCPSCKTGLANEEVVQGRCERCDNLVEKKKIRQWVLGITKYADRLAADVEKLDWPKGIKDMQVNWIGRSEWCEFTMLVDGTQKHFDTIFLASGNAQKLERLQKVFSRIDSQTLVEKHADVVEVVEDGKDAMANALKKLEPYKGKGINSPIITTDSEIHFEGRDFDATHIKREALKSIGKTETECTQEEIGAAMNNFYRELAKKSGGKLEFHYIDAWAILFPNGEVKTHQYKRFYTLTDSPKGELDIYFPMRNLYIAQPTGKYAVDQNEEDFFVEFTNMANALKILTSDTISVYTTRIDTVFGMTYAVIAPDHKDTPKFITSENKQTCEEYIQTAKNKADQERTQEGKEKTWVFTGSYVINPFNGEKVPLWIADYVLGNYWTGAVMAVPAHDERDGEFAKKYGIEIRPVIEPQLATPEENEKAMKWEVFFTEKTSITINSGKFTGLSYESAFEKMSQEIENLWIGATKINYKLRDWLFSRQRYWGEPIPLIHLDPQDVANLPTTPNQGAWVKENTLMIGQKEYSKIYDGMYTKIVCDYNLPLNLPQVERYEPAGDGSSPLATVPEFVNIQLASNLAWKRETNTMPQWGGSCWYYLRFMDAKNPTELVGKEVEQYWGSVDSYVGGAEHAVLHLLYARFWHKFLFDIGVLSTDEPFYRLRNQGMILGQSFIDAKGKLIASDMVEEKDGKFVAKETGEELRQIAAKMSKSLKNVINPDDVVKEYGADTLRLYEMYMWDFKDTKPWDTKAIIGVRRFLDKVWRLFESTPNVVAQDDSEACKILHKTIKKVGEDIEEYRFNTAIAQMMICVNYGMPKDATIAADWKESFLEILHPFAPHIAEELWQQIGKTESIFETSWPQYDAQLVVDDTIQIGVQVNGKVRGDIIIGKDEDKDSVLTKAKTNTDVAKWLEGKEIVKEIYVPEKILNIVIKG